MKTKSGIVALVAIFAVCGVVNKVCASTNLDKAVASCQTLDGTPIKSMRCPIDKMGNCESAECFFPVGESLDEAIKKCKTMYKISDAEYAEITKIEPNYKISAEGEFQKPDDENQWTCLIK
ncbi:MAG: hypothetical protein LBB23_02710 [Rickettsiales bacterium]|nr:hypothetical protein [Rickettsiales bacterium]